MDLDGTQPSGTEVQASLSAGRCPLSTSYADGTRTALDLQGGESDDPRQTLRHPQHQRGSRGSCLSRHRFRHGPKSFRSWTSPGYETEHERDRYSNATDHGVPDLEPMANTSGKNDPTCECRRGTFILCREESPGKNARPEKDKKGNRVLSLFAVDGKKRRCLRKIRFW
jgi:hypothetical protein